MTMQRFQRSKYLSRVVEMRQEVAGWLATYRTILLPESHYRYTSRQLQVADAREGWIEEILDKLEDLEDLLGAIPDAA